MTELWLFLSYLAGSAVTFWLMRNIIEKVLIERCIDRLIADGFLKSKNRSFRGPIFLTIL